MLVIQLLMSSVDCSVQICSITAVCSFFGFLRRWHSLNRAVSSPVHWLREWLITLTSDLGGEVGGVTGDEELQLPVKVAALEVDVPGSNACQEGRESWCEESNMKNWAKRQWECCRYFLTKQGTFSMRDTRQDICLALSVWTWCNLFL